MTTNMNDVVEGMREITTDNTAEMQRLIRNLRNAMRNDEENSYWISTIMYDELLKLKTLVDDTLEKVCEGEKIVNEIAGIEFTPYNA